MAGFHIQVRDMSFQDNLYDVVTISGGGTRSHTLSDLRPATGLFVLRNHEKNEISVYIFESARLGFSKISFLRGC